MRQPPKGILQPDGRIKIAVCFPRALFLKLNQRAEQTGQSFSEVVSDCSACGLLDIEESELFDEPVRSTG